MNVKHWNNTVSTSPERWKCRPSLKQHWGSALPPSYMCDWAVRTDKAGRQDWESNYQHYIDIGPISFFFFFFFFFKIWYLAENKREKDCFPEIPLIEGDVKHPICTFLMTFYGCFWRQKSSNENWEKCQDSHNGHKPTVYNAFFTDLWAFFVIIFTRFSLISQSIHNQFLCN